MTELFNFDEESDGGKKAILREIASRLRRHDPITLEHIRRSIELCEEWLAAKTTR